MTTEEMVIIVRQCGQSIVDNAESIAGDFDFQTDLNISVRLSMEDKIPKIEVCSEFIPEGFAEKAIAKIGEGCL